VPLVDGEIAADARGNPLSGDPENRREERRHPDQAPGLVVAGEEQRGRAQRVVLVVLHVLGLDPRPGPGAVPGGEVEHL
jgi:hypothetical protein